MMIDEDLGHPVVFTFDDTKMDGNFPCIVGLVMFDN